MASQPRWQQVGGNAAEVYERGLVPAMFAPWAPGLLDVAGVRAGEHLLDVACGTGVVARLAAERVGSGGRVVGVDLNPAMLAVARSLPPGSGVAIEWHEASALALSLPDGAFDVVLCQQGLQQLSDCPEALAEMRRVLRPGGRLAASVWGPLERSPGMAALVAALARHVGVAAADNRRAPFALSDAGALSDLVEAAGFQGVAVRAVAGIARFTSPDKLVEYQLAATPLSTLGGLTDAALAAVMRDVRVALAAYVDTDGLAVPMEANLVVACR